MDSPPSDTFVHVMQSPLPLILVIVAIVFAIFWRSGKEAAKRQAVAPARPSAYAPPAEIVDKFCFRCGEEIDGLAEICPKCGVRQPTFQIPAAVAGGASKSKLAAGLLALFLGGIGIHKFYLGRPGQGILYLLFCWTLIPALIGFIEALIYLSMSDQAFNAKYSSATI